MNGITGTQVMATCFAAALLVLNGVVLVVGMIKDAPSTTRFLRSDHGQRWSSVVLILAAVVFLVAFNLLTDAVLALVSSIGGFAIGRATTASKPDQAG